MPELNARCNASNVTEADTSKFAESKYNPFIFAMLKGCGVAPNGDSLNENQNNLDHIAFSEFDHYQYLKQDSVPECSPAEVPESRWEEIFPALKNVPKLEWKRMRPKVQERSEFATNNMTVTSGQTVTPAKLPE